MATVEFEHVHLLERAFVEQEVDALAGGEFTLGVLLVDGFLAAAQPGFGTHLDKRLNLLLLDCHIAS